MDMSIVMVGLGSLVVGGIVHEGRCFWVYTGPKNLLGELGECGFGNAGRCETLEILEFFYIVIEINALKKDDMSTNSNLSSSRVITKKPLVFIAISIRNTFG